MKNITIKAKLLIGFTIIIVFSIVIGLIGYSGQKGIAD
jgi:CHASE3 domain sensor protein